MENHFLKIKPQLISEYPSSMAVLTNHPTRLRLKMTFVFISCDSTEWLVFLLTSALTPEAASQLGHGASPNVLFSSWVSLQNGRLLQSGTGGRLGLSCGLGFGIHTAAVQPRPAGQASPGQSRFKGAEQQTPRLDGRNDKAPWLRSLH